jgi:hypothetical protein
MNEPSPLGPLIELARSELTDAQPRHGAANFAAVRRRMASAQPQRHHAAWRVSLAGLAAAAAIMLGIFQVRRAPLGMEAVAGAISATGEVAPSPQGSTIVFSDGTELSVGAAARATITDRSASGADIRLGHGKARLHVAKRPGASWNVLAGAYRVHVTGTSFAVAFDDALSTVEVELFSGSVRVSGPLLGAGVDVSEGQLLSIDPKRGSFRFEPPEEVVAPRAEAALPATEAVTPLAEVPLPELADASRAPSGRPTRPKTKEREASWSSRVAGGQFEEVLKAAEKRGLDSVYQTASLADLYSLADAARYARRTPIAREALLGIRRRFSGSSQARQAAFLLGRLMEDDAEGKGSALGWYERYLEEDANGVYASQALGRKLLIVHRDSGPAAALSIAREYLRRFPEGPHAPSARKLVTGR